jgi:multiple sugar transport system permease protein
MRLQKLGVYLLLIPLITVVLFPIYWMLIGSLKQQVHIMELPGLAPSLTELTLRNFIELNSPLYPFIATGIKNGLIVASATTVISLFLSSLAAYGLSQFRFKRQDIVLLAIMGTQIFPGIVLILAIYIFYKELHLLNTYIGLVLAYTSFTLPFAIWLLKGFFDSIPSELIDAAQIDGGSRLSTLWHVALPLIMPGLLATSMFIFLIAWDEFLYSLTLTTTNEMRTMAPSLVMTFFTRYNYRWGPMMAASTIVALPVFIMFIFLQKYLVEGLTLGAVKE